MTKSEQTTLGEYISGLKPTKRIRIGCKPAGGFIYEGVVADLNLNVLYKNCALSFVQKTVDNMITFATSTNHRRLEKNIQPIIDKYYDMKPLATRKVLMDYPGQFEPDVRVIIIPGEEKLFDYDPEVPPLTAETMDDQAANRLIGAIYETAVEDLVNSTVTMKRSKNREAKDRARANMQHTRNWIRRDLYGILSDPERIVEACKIRAEQILENNETSMKKKK